MVSHTAAFLSISKRAFNTNTAGFMPAGAMAVGQKEQTDSVGLQVFS